MRYTLLLLALLAGCATAPLSSSCLDETTVALYVSVSQAVSGDDWLQRLNALSHANQDGTDAAVAHALKIDAALAAGGDVSAAVRVQHERSWLASRKG